MDHNILLTTAFAFMACDGDIDPQEVALIRQMGADGLFPEADTDAALDRLLADLNRRGHDFLRDYLHAVAEASLTPADGLELLRVAVRTIFIDQEPKYSEVKFFRAVRQQIPSLTDQEVLNALPEIDDFWLVPDAKGPEQDYFESVTLPQFATSTLKKPS